jgi:hypothetical protein
MLLSYQHSLAADFPFQDEIGYVDRLHHLPETGLLHYLFDRYWTYYIPTQLFIWYQFYVLGHLNIVAIRYTGAAISALVSVLLCVMLSQKAARLNALTVLVILCGPFLVCSYNHWASYLQSIESLVEPLLFGLVLATLWIGERIGANPDGGVTVASALRWTGLCVLTWLLAIGMGPSALVVPAAIVGARVLLDRRFDRSLIPLAILAVALPVWYLGAGEGLHSHWSASLSAIAPSDLVTGVDAAIGMVGNALFSPGPDWAENITRALGAIMVLALAAFTVYALRLPAGQRSRFMVPLALTLYTVLALGEIIVTRLHVPSLGFTPRYTMFLLSAPVSLLFWFVLLPDSLRWKRAAGIGTLAIVTFGVTLADAQALHHLPFTEAALARVRATQMSLHADPTPLEQAEMSVNPPLLSFVYPDVQFMRREHLAEYEGQQTTADTTQQTTADATQQTTPAPAKDALTVVAYGPATITARTPFNVQRDGSSAIWIETNPTTVGEVYIVINGTRLPVHHRDNVVAATVPSRLFDKPGIYKMYVLETMQEHSKESQPVDFIVH